MNQDAELLKYKIIAKLGEGTYGEVYKVVDEYTNEILAMKKVKMEHDEEGVPGTAIREISLLRELHSEYVVQLKKVLH